MSSPRVDNVPPHLDATEIESEALERAWPPLVPLRQEDTPTFPVQALPSSLADWVAAESEATQTSPDMAALFALAAAASRTAKLVEVSPWEGWIEPTNLYVAAVLDPANRKSAVFRDAVETLKSIEDEQSENLRDSVAIAQSQRRRLEKELTDQEKKAATSNDALQRAEARQNADNLARQLASTPEPALPRLVVDDITSERVVVLMAQNNERLAVMSAEGGVFDLMAGKYAKNRSNDFEIYLKGHSGDSVRVERQSRETVALRQPALTLALAIQPEVIRGLADKEAFRGRGLLARFLYAIPPSRIGSRQIRTNPVPEVIKYAYEHTIRSLNAIPPREDLRRHLLRLREDALPLFVQFAQNIESELGEGRLSGMRDWGGKLLGHTARVAAIIHCVKHCGAAGLNLPIDDETIKSSIRIAEWSIPHASATFGLLQCGQDSETREDAHQIVRRIVRQSPVADEVSRREIQRWFQSRFNDEQKRLDDALRLLQETNHLSLKQENRRGGRELYLVSPRLLRQPRPEIMNSGDSGGPPDHLSLMSLGFAEPDSQNDLHTVRTVGSL